MFVKRVFIRKGNGCLLVELTFKVYVKIDEVFFEDVRNRVGVGNDTFHYIFVELNIDFADHRRK